MSETNESFGQQELNTGNNEFNVQQFMIKQLMGRMNTSTLVKVVAVHAPVGVVPVGFVDIVPLVNQIDGANGVISHTTVFNIPYMRIQGGANAVIIDPQAGDIGVCLFAQSDISAVKSTKATANPGSKRKFDIADGMYMGGMLNAAPERYLMIDDDGVTIEGVSLVTINATNIVINGTTTINGNTRINGVGVVSGDLTAEGVSVHDHVHSGVSRGIFKTDAPD